MNKRFEFYKYNILKYLDKNSKILVVGSGEDDFNLFKNNKFKNFTCSNLGGKEINGNTFKQLDINNINELDESYDYVVAHACIHHCSKPHNGILEMYRVAKKGVLVIESKDSFLMKLMIALNFAEKYELSAISSSDEFGDQGGVDNTSIPNYIYRWTEHEIEKLVNSYNPRYKHIIDFNYRFNYENFLLKFNNKIINTFIQFFLKLLMSALQLIITKQGNLFSFFINKEESKKLKHHWIK